MNFSQPCRWPAIFGLGLAISKVAFPFGPFSFKTNKIRTQLSDVCAIWENTTFSVNSRVLSLSFFYRRKPNFYCRKTDILASKTFFFSSKRHFLLSKSDLFQSKSDVYCRNAIFSVEKRNFPSKTDIFPSRPQKIQSKTEKNNIQT